MAFDNLIGNDKVKITLENFIKTNTIVHSYMFIGPSGIRKNPICKRICKNDIMRRRK